VTISDTKQTGATALTIGGTAATSVLVLNATTITTVTPQHSARAVDVTVTTAGGRHSLIAASWVVSVSAATQRHDAARG
jgi:hypothetical protein